MQWLLIGAAAVLVGLIGLSPSARRYWKMKRM